MSTTTKTTRKTLIGTERLNLSRNGNPRFRFIFSDGTTALLRSDAAFGYEAENEPFRSGCEVDVTWTRSGRVTYMRAVD